MKKTTKKTAKPVAKFVAWVAKMADISTPKTRTTQYPKMYGVLADTRVDAPRTFRSKSAALHWVLDQLRPLTGEERGGKIRKGIVYGPEGRRRSMIQGRAQLYVINTKAKDYQIAKAYAAGFVRAARTPKAA